MLSISPEYPKPREKVSYVITEIISGGYLQIYRGLKVINIFTGAKIKLLPYWVGLCVSGSGLDQTQTQNPKP